MDENNVKAVARRAQCLMALGGVDNLEVRVQFACMCRCACADVHVYKFVLPAFANRVYFDLQQAVRDFETAKRLVGDATSQRKFMQEYVMCAHSCPAAVRDVCAFMPRCCS
jgi:hypothetical protein